MWMAYSDVIEVKDLESGVKRIKNEFEKLKFDAEHEANYGMGRFYSEQECLDIAHKYKKGIEACSLFLKEEICVHCFADTLQNLDLRGFLHFIEDYIPEDIEIYSEESNSDNDNDN